MRFDLHTHTVYSRHWFWGMDALNTPEEMVKAAIRRGLSGMAITDHDNIKGGLKAKAFARKFKDFTLITGTEINSRNGHIVGLGIKENVPPNLSAEETMEKIRDLGGLAVAAHPFAKFWLRTCLQEKAAKADAIEILNACTCKQFQNRLAAKLSRKSGVPGIASSDSHCTRTVGIAGISCEGEPLNAIRKGRFVTYGRIAKNSDFLYLVGKKYERSIKCKAQAGRRMARSYRKRPID